MSPRFVMPSLLTLLLVLVVLTAPARADDETAARLFDQGTRHLEQADFKEALKAYGDAARAAPKNERYRAQFALVRRNVQLRAALDTIEDAKRWDLTALALRSFYADNRVYEEALVIDRQRHARLDTVQTASVLAETQLILNLNRETIDLLDPLGDRQTPRTNVQRGIARARTGDAAAAREILKKVVLPAGELVPALWFDVACLDALLGDADASAAALARAFQQTPPSRLAALKSQARMHPDLSGALANGAFGAVWSTRSLVKESECSSGSSCSACPSRAACGDK